MKRITLILDGSADRPNACGGEHTEPGRAGAEGHEAASRKDHT